LAFFFELAASINPTIEHLLSNASFPISSGTTFLSPIANYTLYYFINDSLFWTNLIPVPIPGLGFDGAGTNHLFGIGKSLLANLSLNGWNEA